jgi:diadenosine tetraphosphate (Ap4A) HIT family hydrolase
MPQLITREEALRRIQAEVGEGVCLMCALRDDRAGERWVVADEDDMLVVLPRYVRRWGQVLVVLKPHVTSFTDVDEEMWLRASRVARHAACVVEAELKPLRCYLASTGSAAGEITQSSMHLHIHVIPLYQPDDRPADIFSWSSGVYVADTEEWRALCEKLSDAWRARREAQRRSG